MVAGMVVVILIPPHSRWGRHRGWPLWAARSRGLPRSIRIALEPLEPDQLVPKAGIRGVQPTRIREHEDPGVTHAFRLRAGARARARPEERAIDGDADEGDDLRLHARNDARKLRAPGLELAPGELGGRAGGSRNDVGESEAARRQPSVVLVGESVGDQPRGVQEPPERVPAPGEVVADLRGAERWIDANEKDARPRAEPGGEALHGPDPRGPRPRARSRAPRAGPPAPPGGTGERGRCSLRPSREFPRATPER